MIFSSNWSFLYYLDEYGIVNGYYQNLVKLLQQYILANTDVKINITLCGDNYLFKNNNKTIKININFEHTLVKKGGRSIKSGTPFGTIDDDDGGKYYVRIDRFDTLNKSDIIIDYSIPNIYNISSCALFTVFSSKQVYVSSSIYESYFNKDNRNIKSLTTFINTSEPRRFKLLNLLTEHININNVFGISELADLYKKTKILINIHQTPHHHTCEELRILPALECGVIVISEQSPLTELIPFKNLIVWTTFDMIVDTAREVLLNYNMYHDKIFSCDNITLIHDLKSKNYDTLAAKINQCITI